MLSGYIRQNKQTKQKKENTFLLQSKIYAVWLIQDFIPLSYSN